MTRVSGKPKVVNLRWFKIGLTTLNTKGIITCHIAANPESYKEWGFGYEGLMTPKRP
jgi:hypothetical protein